LARYLVGEADLNSVHTNCVEANLNDQSSTGFLSKVPVDENLVPPENRIPRCHVASWRFKNGALGSLIHGALLQGLAYDADLEILADGLRIRLEGPYSTKPTLKVLSGTSDDEIKYEFSDDDMYFTEVAEFIDAIQQKRAVRCTYIDGMNTFMLASKIRDTALENINRKDLELKTK
jgi:hypothetical protein